MLSIRASLVLAGILAIALALGACKRTDRPGTEPQGEQIGEAAPDFTAPALDREAFSLAEFRGNVVLLNFWATWCAPCVVEVPHLVRLQDELRGDGLVIAGISQDTGPVAEADIRLFADRHMVNYPLILDPEFRVAMQYGVHALPTTIAVDRRGVIRDRKVGLLTHEDLRFMVSNLIDEES